MKKLLTVVMSALLAMALTSAASAAEQGSADDAKAMVKRAVAFIKANGKEAAFAEFSSKTGQFRDRDLYVFVQDMKGNTLAHGGNDRLVGKNLAELRDADGKFFIKAMSAIAADKGQGWVDYKWPNPVTRVVEPKSTYVEKYEDVYIGCGIYKK